MNKFKISIEGWGSDIAVGRIPEATYKYFVKNKIDLSDYAYDDDREMDIPQEHRFFGDDHWDQCNSIGDAIGPELIDISRIVLKNVSEQELDSCSLELSSLEKKKVKVVRDLQISTDNEYAGTCVFLGQKIYKGQFFDFEVIDEEFDFSELTLHVTSINHQSIVSAVTYKSQRFDDSITESLSAKDNQFELQVSKNKRKPPQVNISKYKNQLTDWFNDGQTPVNVGQYEVEFSDGRLGSYLCNWNGEHFEKPTDETGKHIQGWNNRNDSVRRWRGLKAQL